MSKVSPDADQLEPANSLPLADSMESNNNEARRSASLQASPEIDDIVGALGGLRLIPRRKEEETEVEVMSHADIMNVGHTTEIPLSPKDDVQPPTLETAKPPNKQHERMIAETIKRMQEGVKDGEWEMLYQSDESEAAEDDKDTVVISKREKKEASIATDTQIPPSYVDKLKTSMWSAWGRWRGGGE